MFNFKRLMFFLVMSSGECMFVQEKKLHTQNLSFTAYPVDGVVSSSLNKLFLIVFRYMKSDEEPLLTEDVTE